MKMYNLYVYVNIFILVFKILIIYENLDKIIFLKIVRRINVLKYCFYLYF